MKMPVLIKEKTIGKIIEVPVGKIVPNPNQPRKSFDSAALSGLAESIEHNGIIEPLTVRECGDRYELVAGERRLRAAVMCGLEVVPCIIVEVSDEDSALLAIVENIQRKDLNFFEEADAVQKMIDIFGLTQDEAASRLGKTQSTVANKLRLLKMQPDERKSITEYELTERHARAILKIPDHAKRMEVIERIHKNALNVDSTEKLIERMLSEDRKTVKLKKRSNLFRHMSLFSNSINHAVDIMRASGVDCDSRRINGDGYVEFVVRVSTRNMKE